MAVRIQVRRGTTSEWNSADPTLFEGEFGYNTTLDKFKIGDGTSAWSVLEYVPTSADLSTSLGDYIALTEKGGADGVAELDASYNVLTKTAVMFEGANADAYETTLLATEPTADRTITLPNATGTVALTSDITTAVNNLIDGAPGALDTLNELAAAINDDASYASTITTALGLKAPLANPTFTGTVTFTGATVVGISSYSAPTLGSTSIASGATVTTIAGLTLSSPTITGSLTAGGGTGTSGQVLVSTGTGVQWTTPAAGAAFSEFMLIGA
jgi:hypothetical protein